MLIADAAVFHAAIDITRYYCHAAAKMLFSPLSLMMDMPLSLTHYCCHAFAFYAIILLSYAAPLLPCRDTPYTFSFAAIIFIHFHAAADDIADAFFMPLSLPPPAAAIISI